MILRRNALPSFLDPGVDVGMVQVGNEINNGMAGEEDVDTVMDLIASGSRAVREIAKGLRKRHQGCRSLYQY